MPNAGTKFACLVLVGLLATGCSRFLRKDGSKETVLRELTQQNEQLQQKLVQQRRQIEQLQQELTILREFPSDRFENLVRVERVEFGRFTRPYDDNADGIDDGVVVYLVLRDGQGDNIKAAGQVEIELWDLAADEGKRHLGRWHFDFYEFLDYWLGGALADHFKFKLPWTPNSLPQHANLTLKLLFKDALTGKVYEIQKMLHVRVE